MEDKKKAVIYCRVSTKEQVEDGNSLKTQEKICKEYALKYGYEISQVFIELGESAKTADRTELKKLLSFCTSKKEKISAIIVYRIDRLSRQMEDYTVIKSKLKQSGVEIKSTAEYFEDNPAGRFMENIIANVAQFDNDVRTERSTNGMKEAVREGRYVWMAPYGYSNGIVNNKPNILPNEYAPIVREAFELVAQDILPMEHVRQHLLKKYVSKKDIKIPSESRFPEMLRKELYAGWINMFGERHKGVYTPIISSVLFDKVQSIINGNKLKGIAHKVKIQDFPLRKFFFHPTGLRITGAWSQGKRKKYPYYFFHLPKCIYPKKQLEQAFLNLLHERRLPPKYFIKLAKGVHEELTMKQEISYKSKELYVRQIEQFKEKQHILIQKNLDGTLSDMILKEELNILKQEISALEKKNDEPIKEYINFDSLLPHIREFVEHPTTIWKNAYFKGKLQLQWFYFPKGIILDGFNCRTPETCRIFKLKELINDNNSSNVHHPNFKLNTTSTSLSPSYHENVQLQQHEFWEKIGEELKELYEIKKNMERNGEED